MEDYVSTDKIRQPCSSSDTVEQLVMQYHRLYSIKYCLCVLFSVTVQNHKNCDVLNPAIYIDICIIHKHNLLIPPYPALLPL